MKVLNFFKKFLGVYVGIVFVLIMILTPFIGYQFRRNYACDDIWILLAVVILVCFLFWILSKLKNQNRKLWETLHSDKCFYRVLIIGSVILAACQLFIANGAWFIAGWDTRNVIFPDMQMNSDYMSMYPNQLFLTGLFRRIYFLLTNAFGMDFYAYYFCLVLLSCFCVFASVIFVGLIAKKIMPSFIALITFLCAVLFLGFSPWIMVPYSDTFAMLIVTLTLFFYVYINNKPLKFFLIIFISIIGYSIKPTAIFVLLAILFVEICLLIKNWRNINWDINKTKTMKIASLAICAGLGFGVAGLISSKVCDYGVQIDENRSFTATHFLMMGINLENHGGWNNEDVSISRSYPNVKEREAGNLREWQHRLFNYGIPEISFILLNKTLTNFNDGSFAWEAELPWMMENRGDNPIVWAYYGIDPADAHNDNNNVSAYPRQALWLMILLGVAFSFFVKKPKKSEYVVYLSLLAISAFLTVCEPDPRYFLLYVPFFVLIAPKGWFTFVHYIYDDKIKTKKGSKYGNY